MSVKTRSMVAWGLAAGHSSSGGIVTATSFTTLFSCAGGDASAGEKPAMHMATAAARAAIVVRDSARRNMLFPLSAVSPSSTTCAPSRRQVKERSMWRATPRGDETPGQAPQARTAQNRPDLLCGGSGIRTHGGLPHTRFPSVPIRPLSHPSWGRAPRLTPVALGTGQAIVSEARGRRWRPGPVQPQPVNRVRAGRQQLSAELAVCRRSPGRHLGSRASPFPGTWMPVAGGHRRRGTGGHR